MDNIGYLFMNCSKKLKYELNEALMVKNITIQQWAVVNQIELNSRRDKTSKAVEIAKILDMDKPTISGIVKRLEKKKLITKTRNIEDSRSYCLQLTAEGKRIVQTCQQLSDDLMGLFLKPLTPQEVTGLQKVLMKLNKEEVQWKQF
ncbi:winged helix DNA-binding protein [Listeria innocua]|uniref:MarR family winged helix-turn-helix transcriptional regulator n=1 Tax=Listeria innocua TaxID=1642 RepID=UPI0010DEA22A|nr:MarR family transcriptional regulator [Listeria innocua]MBC6118071.1 winged helix DNA-binding protein [Listeria innocua]MBC6139126.1 winged helix DNA-binding protein [Listeria innocua]